MQIYNIYNGSGVIYSVTRTNTSFFCPSGRDFPTPTLLCQYWRNINKIEKTTSLCPSGHNYPSLILICSLKEPTTINLQVRYRCIIE